MSKFADTIKPQYHIYLLKTPTIMKQLIKLSLLTLAFLMPAVATAEDFAVGGIYYNINGDEATVTYKGASPSSTYYEYFGDVTIPATVTWEGTTYPVTAIGEGAFSNCSEVTSVSIPNSVIDIGKNAFFSCKRLTSIVIPNSVTAIGEAAFNYCSGLISATIGNSVLTIGNSAFAQCTNLTDIVLGNSVTSIGMAAFSLCYNLGSVTIPSSVTEISNLAFNDANVDYFIVDGGNPKFDSRDNCNAIIETATNKLIWGSNHTVIPNTVKLISSGSFGSRRGLTSINIPKSVTSMGNLLFKGCTSLTSITVDSDNPKYDSRDNCNAIIETATNKLMEGSVNTIIPSTVTAIAGYAFTERELTTFVIPDNVTDIGSSAFSSCSMLTSITLPNAITDIKFNTFSNCKSLTSIDIPNTVTSIGSAAFSYCDGLTSVVIPNSVTEIISSAFYLCKNLTTVTIPGSVTQIGKSSFYDCPNLTTVYSYINDPSVVDIGYNAFQDYPNPDYDKRTLYVPQGTTEAYQNHTAWGPYFGTIIEMESEQQPGDINGDGKVSITDVTFLINILLENGDVPDNADVNGDGKVNIGDVVALIDILLNGND